MSAGGSLHNQSWINSKKKGDEELQSIELENLTNNDIQKDPLEASEQPLRINDDRSLWQKIWQGPLQSEDEPPKFFLTSKTLVFINDIPSLWKDTTLGKNYRRYGILFVYLTLWFSLVFAIVMPYLTHVPQFKPNSETHARNIIPLTCTQTLKSWKGKNNACGLDASLCSPFDKEEVFVRCPAFCDRAWIYSAVTVGDQRVKYREFNIGGGSRKQDEELSYPYRGDSGVCSSAYHSGLISGLSGGCVKVSMKGPQFNFPGRNGKSGWSVSFNSFFPSSFIFTEMKNGISNGCFDPRSLVMMLNVLLSLPVFYLYESLIGYWVVTLVGFWTLVLIFDPPILSDPNNLNTLAELVSIGFQRLLPLCFILYVIWKSSVKRTLEDGSPLIKATLWFPMFWLGVMNNVTFDRLPVDRLKLSDLRELAGAIIAVGSIISTILLCAVIQAYSLWKSGRFVKYLKIAILVIMGVVALTLLPGLSLRIHHYILGMTLVMFCSTRGVSAYLFQGILIGLVISGVGTWGFASIVETNISLLRGEAGASLKPPVFSFNQSAPTQISWETLNSSVISPKFDGYSLLINDVERYVGKDSTIDINELLIDDPSFGDLLKNTVSHSPNSSAPLYVRVAHANTNNSRKERGDYTNAGILNWPQGTWQDPPPGVS